MEKSFVFNSINKDRVYKAEDFASYFASFIGNGIFPNPSSKLQVVDNNDMTITVKEGKGWINGYYYQNTSDFILKIDPADSVLNRIDRVVLRLDFNKRAINLAIKKGEFSSNAEAKQLQRDADAYEIALADIKIDAGAISITQADITDLRLSKELCGIVHGVVDQVDTTAIFNQFEGWYSTTKDNYNKDISTWTKEKKQAFDVWYSKNTQQFSQDFQEWFETLKNKLDGDVAAKLQKQIDQLVSHYEDLTKNVVKSINGKTGDIELKITDIRKDFMQNIFIDYENGSDNNIGDEENPVKTFKKAVSILKNNSDIMNSAPTFHFLTSYTSMIDISCLNIKVHGHDNQIMIYSIEDSNIDFKHSKIIGWGDNSFYIIKSNVTFSDSNICLNNDTYNLAIVNSKVYMTGGKINGRSGQGDVIRVMDASILTLKAVSIEDGNIGLDILGSIVMSSEIKFKNVSSEHQEYWSGKYFE